MDGSYPYQHTPPVLPPPPPHHDYDYEGATSFSGLFSTGRAQVVKLTDWASPANIWPTYKRQLLTTAPLPRMGISPPGRLWIPWPHWPFAILSKLRDWYESPSENPVVFWGVLNEGKKLGPGRLQALATGDIAGSRSMGSLCWSQLVCSSPCSGRGMWEAWFG